MTVFITVYSTKFAVFRPCDAIAFFYAEYQSKALELLPPGANHILGLEEAGGKTGKQRFLDTMASISKSYSLCSTLDEAQQFHLEIAFLSAVRAAIVKNTTIDQKLAEEQKNSAMKQRPIRWPVVSHPADTCNAATS